MSLQTAYLGLGSNIDAPANIRSTMLALDHSFTETSFSPVYRSPAVGLEGDDFLNLAARVETSLSPLQLAEWLHQLEYRHGRDRSKPRWSSRTLDVDILLYDDLWLVSPALEIPRREILEMPHVLKPLADLAPELLHPVERKTMAELWSQFPRQDLNLTRIAL